MCKMSDESTSSPSFVGSFFWALAPAPGCCGAFVVEVRAGVVSIGEGDFCAGDLRRPDCDGREIAEIKSTVMIKRARNCQRWARSGCIFIRRRSEPLRVDRACREATSPILSMPIRPASDVGHVYVLRACFVARP